MERMVGKAMLCGPMNTGLALAAGFACVYLSGLVQAVVPARVEAPGHADEDGGYMIAALMDAIEQATAALWRGDGAVEDAERLYQQSVRDPAAKQPPGRSPLLGRVARAVVPWAPWPVPRDRA